MPRLAWNLVVDQALDKFLVRPQSLHFLFGCFVSYACADAVLFQSSAALSNPQIAHITRVAHVPAKIAHAQNTGICSYLREHGVLRACTGRAQSSSLERPRPRKPNSPEHRNESAQRDNLHDQRKEERRRIGYRYDARR